MKMKKMLSILLLLSMLLSTLISCGAVSPAGQEQFAPETYPDEAQASDAAFLSGLGDLRVMSYNVLTTMSGNSTLKQNRYQAVLQEIKGYAPTLLGLQEDAWHWHEFLRAHLVTNGSYKRINSSVAGGSEYCSIYYDTTVLGDPVASGAYYLTHSGKSGANALRWEDVPQRHRDALAMTQESHMRSNHAISCYIDGKLYTENDSVLDVRLMSYGIFELNGQRFLYVNTHLQHRSQNGKLATNIPEFLELREMERKAEWDILVKHVDKLLAHHGDMPVIITGDLNDVMGSASYYHFAEKYDNASKLAKLRKGHDATWNAAFDSGSNGKLHATVNARDGQASTTLDYCFLSPNDFTVEQYQTGEGRVWLTNENGESGYVYCSDHLPIIIDLSFGKDKDAPTVTLQKPGLETSAVSYYEAAKGPDTSWYDPSRPDGEYTLTTANQLAGFLSLRQKQTCNMKIKLGANMELGEMDPAWISSDNYLFEGVFDGQGHYVSFTASGANSLLGALGNAIVKNLSVQNSSLTIAASGAQRGYGAIASMIAENKSAVLSNIAVACEISQSGAAENVGGLVGLIGKNAKVEFRYCTNSGAVNAEESNAVGGLVGALESGSSVSIYNSANAGKLVGNKYTGGLIGLSRADKLYVSNSANVGDLFAGRCSGGLIGCIELCNDLIVSGCAVMAALDFSSIGAGGTEKDPVMVTAGCQVGGLVGRTYNVQGGVSGITLSGSMKGAANLITKLDKDNNNDYIDYLASGAITGFDSCYANDEKVMSGEKALSNLHYDTILVTMEMTDVDSYLGGSRDASVELSDSRISHRDVIYDEDKFAASGLPLWGARVDQNRRIGDEAEVAYSQLTTPRGYSTEEFYQNEVFDAKRNVLGEAIHHYVWMPKFSAWQTMNGGVMVSTKALREVVENAFHSQNISVIGYQTRVNKNDSTKTDVRIVSAMYRIEKPLAGYRLVLSYLNENGKRITTQKMVYCDTLYTSIKGGEVSYTPDQYAGRYFFTVELESLSMDLQKELTVTVQPFSAEKSGDSVSFTDYRAMTYVLN